MGVDGQRESVKHSAEKTTENDRKRPKTTVKRLHCVLTASLPVAYWFRHPVRHLELSTYKGTKKVRETSDMVRGLPTESTKDTKIKMHMKLDYKSQQITQITQIIKSVKFMWLYVDKRKSSNETNETNKRNHRIRRNAQKYIMVQERNKKVSVSFCVVCG